MAREMTDESKQQLLADFEAAGLSEVQLAISSPALCTLFGVPAPAGAGELAKEWVVERLKTDRRRQRRNDALLKIGASAAVLAAVFSFVGLFRS